ncbi:hypothetical protein V5O48_016011 [Marasmius crinis-equi]|uniref:Cytochrome P450 n=1 Tax=Marasmius crinis-equi TaxID=585013 RepID=A0ABR3ESZ8_9AGAR
MEKWGLLSEQARLAFSAAALGLFNHWVMKRYEPPREKIFHVVFALLVQPAILGWVVYKDDPQAFSVPSVIVNGYCAFYLTLATSIVLYRVSPIHPLAKIPGPVAFRTTKLWRTYICAKGKQQFVLKELHDHYGPIVRTGPNEVSVNDLDSLKAVLGNLPKGQGYLARKRPGDRVGLFFLEGDEHRQRRKQWEKGFSQESIKEYEPMMKRRANLLAEKLAKLGTGGSQVDMALWLGYYAFDFMADMVFDGGSELLENESDYLGHWHLLKSRMAAVEPVTHIPWISSVPFTLEFLSPEAKRFREMALFWANRRMANGPETRDLWYHLVRNFPSNIQIEPTLNGNVQFEHTDSDSKPDVREVIGDAVLAIVAGSDTTASAIASTLWCLAAHPESYKRLMKELDEQYPRDSDPLDASRYSNMKYLTACINESLRVLPPVPSSGPRVVPKGTGGTMISGHFIPEGTQIYVPPYCVHRNPDHFYPRPDDFVPERWLSDDSERVDEDMSRSRIHRADAFIPFSYGSKNCVGKSVARREMIVVLVLLLHKFEFRFGDGFDWRSWPDTQRDAFVVEPAPLKMTMNLR